MKTIQVKSNTIQVEGAPEIPGLFFRKFRGEEDYPHMAAIINSAYQADGDKDISTVEQIERSYNHLQRSDTDKDMIFAEVDGEPVAYGRCQWALVQEDPQDFYQYFLFVHIKGEWRGKRIAHAMGAYLVDRIRVIAAEHPADIPKKLETSASDRHPWHKEFAEGLGFTVYRYGIGMKRPCSEPIEVLPLPEGIEVRPITPEDYRKVFDATAEAFQDHRGYVVPTEEDYQSWLDDPDFNPSLWKVAWDGDQVVGTVLNFINEKQNQEYNRKRGYTENISTRRAWRKRGIARALLTQSIHMFQEMGMEETALGVDTENPSGALNLYLSVGYKEERRFMMYQKTLE